MKLAKMYAAEFKPGGEKECIKCGRQSHGNHCSFCIKKTLLSMGVTDETLKWASAIFRKNRSDEEVNSAIKDIEQEIE